MKGGSAEPPAGQQPLRRRLDGACRRSHLVAALLNGLVPLVVMVSGSLQSPSRTERHLCSVAHVAVGDIDADAEQTLGNIL